MPSWYGFANAVGAAFAFGVQYVPVKKYEIYDGTTFQWFMCNGILFVGFFTALVFQQFENGTPLEVVFGGVLWGISNFMVLPLVKLLGIGLGFSMYHFVNLTVGYCTGRMGLFGVPPVQEIFPGSLFICDFGCVLVLISFIALIFVEQDSSADQQTVSELPPPVVEGIDLEYREMYRRWRLGEGRGSTDSPASVLELNISGSKTFSVGGFSLYGTVAPDSEWFPQISGQSEKSANLGKRGKWQRALSEPAPANVNAHLLENVEYDPAARSTRHWRIRFFGVIMALAAGSVCGVQSVPATLYNHAHPGAPASAVVFPQCLGIWVASTVIYLLYSVVCWFHGWSVPHSAIRPAFFSGSIWAIGFTLMIYGIRDLGFGVGYTIDAVGPILVSSVLSLLVFKEITNKRQIMAYGAAEILQLFGVLLIASFGTNP